MLHDQSALFLKCKGEMRYFLYRIYRKNLWMRAGQLFHFFHCNNLPFGI